MLKISSTNLEIAITTQIRCKVEENGEFTLNAKTATDLINNLPNKNISLISKQGTLEVETENYHTSIKTLPSEDFPLIPQIEVNNGYKIQSEYLKKALDSVIFATSNNQTQPEISGVLIKLGQKVLKTAATDRYRLAEKKVSLEEGVEVEKEVIVPHKTASEVSRLCGGYKGSVGIVLTETQIAFAFNETLVVSRLVEGQFPDYKEIIPTEFLTTIVTPKPELVNGLKAVAIFSQNSNSVLFDYLPEKSTIVLTAENGDLGKSTVEIPSEINGQSGLVMLNYKYILEALQVMDSEKIQIKLINDSSPAIFVPEKDDSYLYLVMPIKN
jgi:DNA polymerase-3 subunit beta